MMIRYLYYWVYTGAQGVSLLPTHKEHDDVRSCHPRCRRSVDEGKEKAARKGEEDEDSTPTRSSAFHGHSVPMGFFFAL